MGLLFLIPLTIGLGVSYLFKNSVNDMAELTSLFTVACLIVSLILAPWQLKVVVLMLAILTPRRIQTFE
ncbi:hypothetical protein [Nostoc sp. UIC 10630]|uniref:hypothetical protein n=1 Tax=Nostoc sp. UIC 10630 TaxID=2100146 RepID=UPI0013D7B0CD|nr:hypothetical protein [Nostoc sp. UIC 10630]NEU82413.1 hypothetical protein [Nostoc sp. UIC 10630]